MDATHTPTLRRAVAVLAAGAFGIAAPLTMTSLSNAAVQSHSHVRDSDGDQMPNTWEVRHGLDAHQPNARKDADHDGLKNVTEFRDHTDPQDSDSDDDGAEDGDDDSPAGDCDDDSRLQRHDGSEECDEDCDDQGTSRSDDGCEDPAPSPARHAAYVVA